MRSAVLVIYAQVRINWKVQFDVFLSMPSSEGGGGIPGARYVEISKVVGR